MYVTSESNLGDSTALRRKNEQLASEQTRPNAHRVAFETSPAIIPLW